ncbi:MFS transporter [Bacillus sp. Marseille-P3661]|uniref:MFS transporter n=1 Tax=Bacillus sp. Marseille-P3661 TaxID=1936234 RepID=UPI002155B06D|nr:MFS transporter [Bacillus sp. Marseille-P3661]
MFLLAISQSTFSILAAGFFYGIAYGTVTPTLQAIAVSNVPKVKQGTANAMFFSSMDLGIAIGSTGLGIVASHAGYHFIYGLSILFLVILLVGYRIIFDKGLTPLKMIRDLKRHPHSINSENKRGA